jgi:AcrR family transcriptional regulator
MAAPASPYRKPKQARARATWAAILQAATRIIETEGEDAFTTNRVAETAGVSIGTLYQYFPNKAAILVAMMHDERDLARRNARGWIEAGLDPDRAMIRAQIQGFAGRPRTRRVALHALLAQEPNLDGAVDAPARRAGRQAVDAFVVTRAVVGVVRAAVLEDSPLLTTPEFEDALVRLARALLKSPAG